MIRIPSAALLAALAWLCLATVAAAQPSFPSLSGRVVDEANILDEAAERDITARLEALEADTSDQLVVVTLSSLQGYEIEDYGYQLGRAWGIGQSETNNGVLLIVAPNERRVRIEVGYGLEPVLTDALSSLIIQRRILPPFRDGDYAAGIGAGVDAIVEQLSLDRVEAEARAQAAAEEVADGGDAVFPILFVVGLFVLFSVMGAIGGARGRRRRFGASALPVILWELSRSSGRGGGWGGGGGGWGGGDGFSGGGGSFGGGGASGGW